MTAPGGPPSGGGNAPTEPKDHPVHPPTPEPDEKDSEKE